MKFPFPDLSDLFRRNKKKLETEKEKLEEEIKGLDKNESFLNSNNDLHEVEFESRAGDMGLKEETRSLRQSLFEYLLQIRNALRLIRKKKYGTCQNCGKPISPERLKVDPSAIYCVDCAKKIETANEAK